MQPLVCLYFQVHQPYRLRDLRITDIGRTDLEYFDTEKNQTIFRKVAEKCYLPANALLKELLERFPHFSVSYCLSGIFLDQCREYGQDVLDSFRSLARTGKVEFLAETYHHSLSSLWSLPECCRQVQAHVKAIEQLFGQTPSTFRNTELIFSNELAHVARLMGFRCILAEGADHLLRGRSPNMPYVPPHFRLPATKEHTIRQLRPLKERSKEIHILLKNYRLSDDIAFRFSDHTWPCFPLHAETFTDWIEAAGGHSINLFMDYETFGEHQWEDTGIFAFLSALPRIWEERGIHAVTPREVLDLWHGEKSIYDAHRCISWADIERDLSAWQGNRIQQASLQSLYDLESLVQRCRKKEILDAWRRLQISDHFYYMCTKYWSDGDVHKYFNPYESPYEAYRRFSHALADLTLRLTAEGSHAQPRRPNSHLPASRF